VPIVAIGEGDALVLRIDGDNAAVAQRDAVWLFTAPVAANLEGKRFAYSPMIYLAVTRRG
jgi:hypothetical protein